MRVDQLTAEKRPVRFVRFYRDVEFCMDEKLRKKHYLTDKIPRVGSRRRAILSYTKTEYPKCVFFNSEKVLIS